MASTIIFNEVEYKNSTAVKNAMRKRVMEVCVKACKAEFGEDFVKEVGSNEWGIVVGQIDDNGCIIDAVTTIKPTAKEWADRKTAKKTYERYDLEDNAQAYEMEVKEKEEERIKKEKEREKKKSEYVIIISGYSDRKPFVFKKDTSDTEKGTRTLENATLWKEALKTDYPNGTIEIRKASEWYKNI